MNVMKFFRKYTNPMMAVFMVALMVAFLLPTTLQHMFRPNPGKMVIAKAFGEEIRVSDRQVVRHQQQVLSYLSSSLQGRPGELNKFYWQALVPFSEDYELDYLLLVREARRMGLVVTSEQVDQTLTAWNVPGELVNRITRESRISVQMFRTIVADYLMVFRAFNISASTMGISDAEMRAMFAMTREQLKVAIVPVDAAMLVKDIKAPSAKQLQTHFDTHTERFRFPNRVVVEYMAVDVEKLKDDVKVSPRRARQYWDEHKDEFFVTTTAPSTNPASSKPVEVKKVLPYEEALPKVIDALKTAKADEKAKIAILEAMRASQKYWHLAPIDKDGNRQVPEKISDYKILADETTKKMKVPIKYGRSPLVGPEEASEVPGLGGAYILENGQPVQFSQYAFRIEPFVESPAKDERRGRERSVLKVRQDSGMLRSGSPKQITGYYIFRVVEAEASRLPTSLAEVKTDVVIDWKLDQAYILAKTLAERIKAEGGRVKLDKITETSDAKLKKDMTNAAVSDAQVRTFPRRYAYGNRVMGPMFYRVKMDGAAFADLCFDKLSEQPTTQPTGKFTTIAIDDDANRIIYVVQLLEKMAAEAKDYDTIKAFLQRQLQNTKQMEFYREWFNPDNIHKRAGYERVELKQ